MNNEIKEILENVFDLAISECPSRDIEKIKKVKDYITNLQEENKRLKQWDCNKDTRNSRQRIANAKQMKQLKDYKSRCEKAIEYINKETKELYSKNKCCKYLGEIMQLETIENILNGDDKNEY